MNLHMFSDSVCLYSLLKFWLIFWCWNSCLFLCMCVCVFLRVQIGHGFLVGDHGWHRVYLLAASTDYMQPKPTARASIQLSFISSTPMEGFSRIMKSACQVVFDGVWYTLWYLGYVCEAVFVSEWLCVFHHNHCKRRKRLCDQQKYQMTAKANKGGSLESRG